KKYGDDRRTQVSEDAATEFALEDLIPHEAMVITISQRGYVKRVPLNTYRLQLRGGRGVTGMVTREEDTVRHLLVADTHDSLLFFTNKGKVYHLKCHELPGDSTRTAKGLPAINLISMEQQEQVTAVVAVRSFTQGEFMVMATRLGEVKKTALEEFSSVRSNGLIAMDLEQGDQLVSARLVSQDDQVVPVTFKGMAIKFAVKELRQASRQSGGVRGIRLGKGDYVVGFNVVREKETLCTVTANGFGKCSYLEDYPLQSRGGTGVKTQIVNKKTGMLTGSVMVSASQELMMISEAGVVIRMTCQEIPKLGRSTQGVILKRLEPGDVVSAVAVLEDRSRDKAPTTKAEQAE
ncbi:MAG: DNA gyrase C-terminal beta-propeller domain-containing protein, partial [Dehalococcoidia bacterium]|nr:DNA gyrase C-terminal beta-propeller domain-containing protein [Dehalococcoidia bacterium]